MAKTGASPTAAAKRKGVAQLPKVKYTPVRYRAYLGFIFKGANSTGLPPVRMIKSGQLIATIMHMFRVPRKE